MKFYCRRRSLESCNLGGCIQFNVLTNFSNITPPAAASDKYTSEPLLSSSSFVFRSEDFPKKYKTDIDSSHLFGVPLLMYSYL